MKVPLLDLNAQYKTIQKELEEAVLKVLRSQRYIGGPKIQELEEEIAKYSDCSYAVGVSSGTDALLISLMALGIGAGDEVITTPFTFFATVGSIVRLGAIPVFVDIDPLTFNINPDLIEEKITDKTKAVIPVHLFGQMADMDIIKNLADEHDIYIIEDAAQAIGSKYNGKKAGSIGNVGCFSFFPSKNLGGIGDGGMVVTSDEDIYNQLLIMRNHGSKPKYYHKCVGGNFRLDAIQAAALLVKLPHLDRWSEQRRKNAAFYNDKFSNSFVKSPYIKPECVSIYNQYCVRVPERDAVKSRLGDNEIGCEIYYPVPMHLQECFRSLAYKQGDFPETEKACEEVLALPSYPELDDDMKQYVVDKVLNK